MCVQGGADQQSSKHLSLAPQRAPIPQGNCHPRFSLGADAVRCGKGGERCLLDCHELHAPSWQNQKTPVGIASLPSPIRHIDQIYRRRRTDL